MREPIMPARLLQLFIIALLFSQVGCSGRATIDGWQSRLEHQAVTHGDMSFLRDQNSMTGYPEFAMLGANTPDKSTDVAGILLGRRTINNSDWLIFLVARVQNRNVDDVRVAMLRDSGIQRDRDWLVSNEDERSTDAYRRFRDSAWRARHPNRDEPPINAFDFPAEDDVYRLEIAGNTVSVLEERSGVRWTLVLPRDRISIAAK